MNAELYLPAMTLREARERYFDLYGFDNGGYDKKWVRLKAGPFVIAFPNIEARKVAVRYHDLHHVLTGYEANWGGEAEIGAWEIGAGCGGYWVAWLLNLSAFGFGLAIAPRRTFRAFVRGRHSNSLYARAFGDDLLALTVAELRARLRLDDAPIAPTLRDRIAFLGWCATITVPWLAAAVVLWLLAF
jgi:hypothetical protein